MECEKIVLNQSSFASGFTLIELVVVITLLSILAVVALPRMTDSYDAAHDSTITATGGALASAVILLRSQWVGNGARSAVDGVQGYGDDDVATTLKGWPSDAQAAGTSKHEANISGDTARCIRIWRALLVASAPTVSGDNDGSTDYWVALPSGTVCRYTYALNDQNSSIEYNLQSGSVITIL
jgi:MSHA pilin protein MshB